jgi:hypothetical protein
VLDPKSMIERDGMAVRVREAYTPLPRSELAALNRPDRCAPHGDRAGGGRKP